MAILSKGCKSDNFESQNSLKFSFTNNRGFRSNFVRCKSLLKSNSLDILVLCEINLENASGCGNFSVISYVLLI